MLAGLGLGLVICVPMGAFAGPTGQAGTRESDIIYRRKQGVALTMDVFRPAKPNGAAVLWMVSGGWVSSHEAINPGYAKPFTDAGYTFIQVVHGAAPRYKVDEIVEDMHRAVRFVRFNAKRFNIDPNRIGISGGSAGGHLSIMMGGFGTLGDPKAADPIDRENSKVQAVACFYPPTDLMNYGKEGAKAIDIPMLKSYWPAFGVNDSTSAADRDKIAAKISPMMGNLKDVPPTLIVHGTSDILVPIQQSERYVSALKAAGRTAQLEVRPGKGHGWPGMESDLELFITWFGKYLPAK
jgi:acetyl esterase/lipase